MDRNERVRRLACCTSEPACFYCPMLPENQEKSLAELARLAMGTWR